MMAAKRSQAGVEFILLVGFMMFVFILLFSALSRNIDIARKAEQRRMLKEVGDIVDREIYLAQYVKNGYSRTFELPLRLDDVEYHIDINPYNPGDLPTNSNNSEVVIYLDDKFQTFNFNYTNVKFFLDMDVNVSRGCNEINKTNGTIIITPLLDSGGDPQPCD